MPMFDRGLLVSTTALSLFAGFLLAGPSGATAASSPAAGGVVVGVPTLLVPVGDTSVASPALSGTGRYVAYAVSSVDSGGALHRRLLRQDRVSGQTEILNRGIAGGVAGGNYSLPVISASGQRIAFTSNSARLVPGDTNARNDAFVRDAATDTTILSSRAFDGGMSNGAAGATSLSKDGRFAVFTDTGTNVVPGSTTTNSDVFLRDLTMGTTRQVTVRPNGTPSRGPGSNSADVSADGRLVSFVSYNTDLAAVDGQDNEADLFVRDMTTGTTRWLSPALPVGANPSGVVISPDGRWVSTRWEDGSLRLTNVASAKTTQVVPNGYALTGSFTANGRLFGYNAAGKAYVRDLSTGIDTELRTPGGGSAGSVSISGDGTLAAYDWVPLGGGVARIFLVTLSTH